MKRFIRRPTIQPIEVEWKVEICLLPDVADIEYQSFIDSLIDMFDGAGFDLYRDSRYVDPTNTTIHCQPFYYTFLKIEDDIEIRVIVCVNCYDIGDKFQIIFDDETYCKSYAAAEFQIRDQIEDLEEAYEEWKQANL